MKATRIVLDTDLAGRPDAFYDRDGAALPCWQ